MRQNELKKGRKMSQYEKNMQRPSQELSKTKADFIPYNERLLKTLEQKLQAIEKLLHETSAGNAHKHKVLDASGLAAAKQLRKEIRGLVAELLGNGVAKEKISKLLEKLCPSTVKFLTDGSS
ncbi:MAG: hypothetical protein N3G80_04640 [Candidatus Micrarchaeota archaeon]|nr:hypothetical protein [Candidatus Micrarchaeota archaeon]